MILWNGIDLNDWRCGCKVSGTLGKPKRLSRFDYLEIQSRPTINMEIPTAKYGKTTKNMEKYGKNACYNEG